MAVRRDHKIEPATWERVKELVASALELDAPERLSFLSRLADEEPSVSAQVGKLVSSHERAGTFLDEPLVLLPDFLEEFEPEQRFSSGDLLCDRFRIVRLIGKGGMGEVYEAWDQELDEAVALKTLRFEISGNEIFTARFRREVQLARKVTHPNVCRIFDNFRHQVGNEAPVAVLSMELLCGETLSEYLKKKGRLSTEEALPLVRQIVDGLQAVHNAGIIHRDLKPSNLILVPEGDGFRVKLTDFGIAGRLSTDPALTALTQGSKALGTPDYMAPEQFEHGRTSVQSDVYSLGLILYEMVTGVKPFAGKTAWERLGVEPPSPKKDLPKIADRWNKTIVCCLEKEPAYRFRTAEAVAHNLVDHTAPESLVPSKPFLVRTKTAAQKGIWFILAFLVISTAISAAAMRYFTNPRVPPGTTVLMMDIMSSDPTLSGITVALKSQLAQSAHLEVEEDNKIAEVLKQMKRKPGERLNTKTAREVAWRSGVPLLIWGSLDLARSGYVLSVHVERIRYHPLFPSASWSQEFTAHDKAALMNVVHEASTWIRTLSGEGAAELANQDRPVEDTTTSSWQALQLYSTAESKRAQGDTASSIVLLKQALEVDPKFTKARMRMADILISIKRYSEGFRQWELARKLISNENLTSRETLRLQAQYAEDTGDFKAAESGFREYKTQYPNDYLAWFYWGSSLDTLGSQQEALAALTRAAQLQPDSPSPHIRAAMIYLSLDHDGDQRCNVVKEIGALKAIGQREWAAWVSAYASLLAGDSSHALDHAEKLSSSPSIEWQSRAYSLKAAVLAETGRRSEGVRVLKDGIAFDHNHIRKSDEADKGIALAYLYYQQGDLSDCIRAAQAAIELDKSPQRLLQAGTLLMRSGLLSSVQPLIDELKKEPSIPRIRIAIARLEGELKLAQGDYKGAIREFQRAVQMQRPFEDQSFLALAYAVAGEEREANNEFSKVLEHPAYLLIYPGDDFPGSWGDLLFQALKNSSKDGSVSCADARQYLSLRLNAEPAVQLWEVNRVRQWQQADCRPR